VFYKDVQDTYMRISNRTKEIIKERAAEEAAGGVEQIQLHAMEPGTVIQIRIPPKDATDEEGKMARELFETFSPEMQRALESESLDQVNKVLGDLKVPEAEDYVEKFGQVSRAFGRIACERKGAREAIGGQAGILSLEEQIIDATTEAGQQQLKDMEKAAAEEKAAEQKKGEAEEIKYDDPE
jgi:cell division cycle protein 37